MLRRRPNECSEKACRHENTLTARPTTPFSGRAKGGAPLKANVILTFDS